MNIIIKRFSELTTEELFEIYYLRVSVFVVEQNCPYQDVDIYDKSALHLMLKDGNELIGYLRILPEKTVFDDVSLGRVISVKRRCGNGSLIVCEGIKAASEYFGARKIVIEAQTYARSLYEKQGFIQCSEEFLEDGIPHIRMELYTD